MPALAYWFSGPAIAAFLVFVGAGYVIVELVFPPVVDLKRVDLHAARDCHELKARTPARQRSADVDGFAGLQCALDRVFRSALPVRCRKRDHPVAIICDDLVAGIKGFREFEPLPAA
jgi:hypothetical protein